MDFDPRHPKWQCCCCRLSSGLKILATVEIIVACLIAALYAYSTFAIALNNPADLSWFAMTLVPMCILCAVTSALLIVGIRQRNVKLMYPTLAARAMLVTFVQVFGVSTVVRPGHITSAETIHAIKENGRWKSKTHEKARCCKPRRAIGRAAIGIFDVFHDLHLDFRLLYDLSGSTLHQIHQRL
ncbi:hypothetical protein Tcan_09192 [Toxocara canis]|uniref:DUF7027 domain-containing protein n=1 Tax=Toxocara canis TaxID=6265 RepID=A0A0B2VM90_TOXCA|nr:hypothetical protein Tcan_09192 [Toxocara canis]